MNTTDTTPTIEHTIGASGVVLIRLADWDAEIRAVDGDTVRVRNADGGPLPAELQVARDADTVTIRQTDRSGLTLVLGRRSQDLRLAVEVPVNAALTIQTASGDVQATGLRGPVRARTASGDLMLVGVVGDVQAETVSGDVAIRLDGPTGLAVRTVSGDVIVEGGRADRFAYTSTSGDLRITSELGGGPHTISTVSGDAIVTTRNGIRISAQTVTGDLGSDLPHTSEGRPGRRSLIVGEGTTVVQFRSTSGDLRVVGPNGDHIPAIPMIPALPAIPQPPAPPAPPAAPAPVATASVTDAGAGPDQATDTDAGSPADDAPTDPASEAVRLEVLRALERGEIDIDEASSRLAALDGQTDD